MSLKVEGRRWDCGNFCKSNCCSEVWLSLSKAQKESFIEKGCWVVGNNYTDWRWLEYHLAIMVVKLLEGQRMISIKDKAYYEIIFNPFKNIDEIHILDKCKMLLPNNKCKIYRARPDICTKAECILFSKALNENLRFYAKNGLLKGIAERKDASVIHH